MSPAVRAEPAPPPGLDDFRVSAPAEIARLLDGLCDDGVPLCINTPDGGAIGTRLLQADAARGVLDFSAAVDDPKLPALLAADEALAVGFLDRIKLQFEVHDSLLVHADDGCTLRCGWPAELWRFQRRGGFRVRPPRSGGSGPVALLRHPALADMRLALRVLDLSIGGCALLLPDDVPGIEAGLRINGVQLRLDAGTTIDVDLLLRHVSNAVPAARGVQLGCEWLRPSREGERSLQRWIDQTQKRQRLLGG